MAKPIAAVMAARRVSRATLLRSTALHAVVGLVMVAPAAAQPAPNARPMGGQVVAGSASIATTPSATNITQSTSRAAIDWRSFDVGSNQSVNFQQPSSAAVTLNRVTGGDPSAIAGKINANGQVILTNPSGVTFYGGAQVNAQSVVVSAAGITNQNFMAGKMVFDQAANPNARIDNRGTITVKQAGLAALVAPSVANSGVINAKLGQVVLAGAAAHTLDMYGDGLVSIDVTKQVTQAPVGPDGKMVTALVTNTGTIRADGGVVQLTAAAADGVVQTLVRAGGKVQANSVGNRTGRIEIAGTGGSVVVEGRVAADGRAPGTPGGQVLVVGSDTTTIAATARVSASGKAGGGLVALGTTLARAGGSGPAPAGTSARTVIAKGARVSADAKDAGNGGRITVLSTQQTGVDGSLSARGGKIGGNGGTIELSGETGFRLTGTADTSAPHGALGTIVLDPYDLTISNAAPAGVTSNPTLGAGDPSLAYDTPDAATNAYVTPAQIQMLTGNVHLQAVHNLTVADSVSYANGALTLEAGNNLTVNALDTAGDPLTLATTMAGTAGMMVLTAGSAAIPGSNSGGMLSVQGSLSASTITLNAGTGGIALGGSVSATGILQFNTSGDVTQSGGVLTTPDLNGVARSVALNGANAVTGIGVSGGGFRTTGGGFLLTTADGSLTIGPQAGFTGSLSVPTGQSITLGADTVTIQGGSNAPNTAVVAAPGGLVVFQPYTASRGITVTSSANAPEGVLGLTTGELQLVSTATLQLGAAMATSGDVTLGQTGETIDLMTGGNIGALSVQTTGAVMQGGPLLVNALSGSAGSVTLSNESNVIPSLAGLASGSAAITTSGDLTVSGTNTGSALNFTALGNLSVTGTVSGVAPVLQAGNQLSISGAVMASGSLILGAGGAGIALSGTVAAQNQIGVSTTGPMTQTAGSVTAADLYGGAGSVSLPSHTNAVTGVATDGDKFTVTSGDFTLASPSLTIGFSTPTPGGGLSVPSGHTVTLATDTLAITANGNAASISAPSGTLAITPFTAGNTTLLTTTAPSPSTGLVVTTAMLTNTTEATLQLGAAVGSVGLPTGTISIGSGAETVDLGSAGFGNTHPTTVSLQAAGLVTQDVGGELAIPGVVSGQAGTLTGQAGTLMLPGTSNFIANLAGFATTAGNLTFHTGQGLTVTGTVSGNGTASNVTLSSAAQVVDATGNGITETGGRPVGMLILGSITGNVVSLNSLPNTGPPTGIEYGMSEVDPTSDVATGTITASSLTAMTGFATLYGNNAVTSLGNFASYEELSVSNGTTPIYVAGNLSSVTYAVSLNGAGIAQDPNSSIVAPQFDATSSADTVLTSINNRIGGVGYVNQNAGNFTLVNGSPTAGNMAAAVPLLFGSNYGTVTATSGSLSFVSDQVGLESGANPGTALTATKGAVSFAPFTAGRRVELIGTSAADPASLSVSSALTGRIAALRLDLGDANTTGTINIGNPGETIGLVGQVGTLQLRTTGAVTQGVSAGASPGGGVSSLNVPNLTGSAGTITLATTGNQISKIGFGDGIAGEVDGLQATQSLNVQTALDLSVANAVTGNASSGMVTLGTTGSMTVLASSLSALNVSLTASGGTLTQTAGLISAGGTLSLNAAGAASQTGGIIAAGTLSGTTGSLTLGQAGNAIQSLAEASSGPVSLTTTGGLSVGNDVSFGDTSLNVLSGDLLFAGYASFGALALNVPAGAATTGDEATLVANTLNGFATSVNLSNTLIATLGDFTATGAYGVSAVAPLTLSGTIRAATIAISTSPEESEGGSLPSPITQTGGSLNAGTISIQSSNDFIQNAGSIAATGAVAIGTNGGLTLSGALSGPSVSLTAATNGSDLGAIAQSGGTITAGTLTGMSDAATSLTAAGNAVTTLGSFSAGGTFALANAQTLTQSGTLMATSASLSVAGGDLDLQGAVTAPASVSLVASGGVSGGTITTALLSGSAGSAVLNGTGNAVGTLAGFTTIGPFALTDGQALTVTGPVNAGSSSLSLAVTGNLALNGGVAGGAVSLASTAAITEGAGGTLTAATLTGSANTASLGGSNAIGTLGSFTTTAGFALANGQGLAVSGPVTDGQSVALTVAGGLVLAGTVSAPVVTLVSTAGPGAPGGIDQTGGTVTASTSLTLSSTGSVGQVGGTIVAGTLGGSAGGAVSLGSAGNMVGTLAGFGTPGAFALVDAQALTVTGPVSAGTSSLSLTASGNLAVNGSLIGGAIALASTAAITEGAGGTLTAATLTGSANTASLGGSNTIGTLGSFTTAAGFALANGQGLAVSGPVTDGQSVALTVAGGLVLAGTVSAPVVTLVSTAGPAAPGGIDQTGGTVTASTSLTMSSTGSVGQVGGTIVAGTLGGSAGGAVSLGSAGNMVGALAGFTTPGSFVLTDGQALTVTGPVNAGSSPLSLAASGNLTLNGGLSGGAIALASTAAITEGPGGTLTAATLTGSADAASLAGSNSIGTLGSFTTAAGFALANGQGLAVSGPVTDGQSVALTVAGGLVLAGTLSAPVVTLVSTAGPAAQGGIDQTGGTVTASTSLTLSSSGSIGQTGGTIVAGALGGSSGGATSLGSAGNMVGTLAGFSTTGPFALNDDQALTVSGPVNAGSSPLSLAASGNLALNGSLAGGAVSLVSTAAVTEGAGGMLTAATLTGSANAASLGGTNTIGTLGGFTTIAGLGLANGQGLVVTGPVTDGQSVALNAAGGLVLAGTVSAPVVTLVSVAGPGAPGGIDQTGGTVTASTSLTLGSTGSVGQVGGTIVAGTLRGSAGGAVSLGSTANAVATLGSFNSAGGFSLADGQSLAVVGPVTDSASVALGTPGSLALGGAVTTGMLSLTTGTAVTQPGGSLAAASLTGSAGSLSLSQPGNAIGTLAGFSTTGAFTLTDGQALTVTGPVNAGSSPLSLAVTGNLTLNGGLSGGAVALASTAAISEGAGGTLTAATLTGSANTASLGGSNSIGTLGSFTTAAGFALANGQGLVVSGPVTDGQSVALTVAGGLVLAGTVSAPVVTLVSTAGPAAPGGIEQTGGTVTASTSLTLSSTGSIGQTGGTIVAGTLSGSAGGPASLGSLGNGIATLAGFSTAGDFTLYDGRSLTVSGPVDPNTVTLSVVGSLTLASSVTGGTVDLIATGPIVEAAGGSVTATTLTGSADAASLGGTNTVGTLGRFTTTTGFALANSQGLVVSGPVTDGQSVAVNAAGGGLLLTGTVSAPVVTLVSTAGPSVPGGISQTAGTVTASTSLTLISSGSIGQTGGVIAAGALAGTAGGPTSLGSAGNAIVTLGGFSSTGGFALADGGSLSVSGPVMDSTGVAIAAQGALSLGGMVTTGALSLTTGGAITQPGGSLVAASLAGSAGSVALTQRGNQVGTLGGFVSGADFTLTDSAALTVSGGVSAGPGNTVTLTADSLTFGAGGSLSGNQVVLAEYTPGNGVTLGGGGGLTGTPPVTATTLVIGTAAGGPIDIAGAFNLATVATLDLQSAGAISETGTGAIHVAALTGSGGSAKLGGANQIGAVQGFSAGPFVLNNAGDLVVGGLDASAASLSVAGNLSFTGTNVVSGALSLAAAGAVGEDPTGMVAAASLSGTAASVTLASISNSVGTLAGFATMGTFTLGGSNALTVSGPVSASQISLSAVAGLTLDSTLNAGAVSLNTASTLVEGAGGSIAATTLTGQARVANLGGANGIAQLGAFSTTGGFTLVNAQPLSVIGPVSDQQAIALSTAGPLTLGGTVAATSVTLASTGVSGAIEQTAGRVSGTTSLMLVSSGPISQVGGTITAGTLVGSAGGPTSLGSAGNAVATLGGFSSVGGFGLADATSLQVTGLLADGTGVELSVSGALVLGGTVQTGALGLNAAAITQPGGSVLASSLSGSAGGAALGQRGNQVGTVGAFASTGDFLLTDSVPLTITGAVSAGPSRTLTLVDDAPSFAAGGSLSAPGGTVALAEYTAGSGITIAGGSGLDATPPVTATTLVVGAPTGGPIVVGAPFNLSTVSVLDLESAGAIGETGTGAIRVGTLTGSGASASLGGANQIGALGRFTTPGTFSLVDAQGLAVTGRLGAAAANLVVSGDVALSGTILAPAGVSLVASGAITQPGGGITTDSLSGRAGSATLGGAGNAVGTLAGFTTNGAFALVDGVGLTVSAPVGASSIALSAQGSLTLTSSVTGNAVALSSTGTLASGAGGAVIATTLSGSAGAVALTGQNRIATLGSFQAGGGFSLADAQPLAIAGPVTGGGAVTVSSVGDMALSGSISAPVLSLAANSGSITQSAGAIAAGSAAGLSAAGGITQTGGSITAGGSGTPGALTLTAGGPVTIGGSVTAGNLAIAAAGAITQTGGSLVTSGFSASAGGAISLGVAGFSTIATVGNLTSPTGIALVDSGPLQIVGTLASPELAVIATRSLTLDGGIIQTDGLPVGQQRGAGPSLPGSYFQVVPGLDGTAAISQLGTTLVLPYSGGASTVRFDLPTGGGSLSLNALSADGSNVILSLGSGKGMGTIDAASLTVLASGGTGEFGGQVSGRTDFDAAQVSQISPVVSNMYTLNGCAIGAQSCSGQSTLLTTITAAEAAAASSIIRPDILTLDVLDLSVTRDRDDPTLLLPNISDRDY